MGKAQRRLEATDAVSGSLSMRVSPACNESTGDVSRRIQKSPPRRLE